MHLKEVDANLLVTLDALLVDASVTRAAERLGRSASAVSHGLAKLREIFDDELFVRAGQRLVPTAKAQELAPTVHVILAGMESLLRSNRPFDPSLSVRGFAAAASEAAELILVEPLRDRLEARAPNVRLDWTPSRPDENVNALRSAHSHFVIEFEGETAMAPDVRSSRLFDDRLATLGRAKHPFSRKPPDAERFAAAEHVEVDGLPALDRMNQALGQSGLSCNIASHVSSTLAGVLVILNSDGLLTLPASLASILEAQFGLARIDPPLPTASLPLRLLWHASYDRDECHEWLRAQLADIATDIAASDSPAGPHEPAH